MVLCTYLHSEAGLDELKGVHKVHTGIYTILMSCVMQYMCSLRTHLHGEAGLDQLEGVHEGAGRDTSARPSD